jgi:hypothetical protein
MRMQSAFGEKALVGLCVVFLCGLVQHAQLGSAQAVGIVDRYAPARDNVHTRRAPQKRSRSFTRLSRTHAHARTVAGWFSMRRRARCRRALS